MFQNFVRVQPPHIRWETRSIEKRKLVEEGGGRYFIDVDFAVVTPIGSRDSVEKEVQPWFTQLEFECNQMPPRFDREWLDKIRASYERWKKGEELPIEGTSIKNWPVATPAEVKRMQQAGIRTVEDLCTANQETLDRIGMGGVSLKNRAVEWTQGKLGLGPIVEKVDALTESLKVISEQNKSLIETIKVKDAEIAARDRVIAAHAVPLSPADRALSRERQLENEALLPMEEGAVDAAVRSLG